MTLDNTAKQANVEGSLKKYFVDSIETAEGVPVAFDKYLSTPNLHGKALTEWVTVNFGNLAMSAMSAHDLHIYCCTRSDNEGFNLAQLRDKVFKYLSDNTKTDGMARIPFYDVATWTLLDGGFVVQDVIESQKFDADDGTKFKILTVQLRFSSKV